MLLLYSIFNKLGVMMFSWFIDSNHVKSTKKYIIIPNYYINIVTVK